MKMLARTPRFLAIGLGAILALSITPAQAGKLKKWIDENGQVQYGDSIPPRYAKKSIQTLNNEGVVIETRAAAKTPEQIAEEKRLAALKASQERIRKAQERKDRILLDTFTNEDEMIMTRDGKVEAIEAIIRVTRGRIEKIRQRLSSQKQRAANMERAGKPVPESITKKIAELRAQIRQNLAYIEKRKQDQQAIKDKFEADIKRFRELKAKAHQALDTAHK